MRIDIWSDIVCPWCFIGKRRLDAALDRFEHRDRVEVVWRAFQLDPSLPREPGPSAIEVMAGPGGDHAATTARLADIVRIGAADGLDLRLTTARPVDTFDAHRLSAWARTRDHQGAMVERLLHAYHAENRTIADRGVLAGLAADVGLDPAEAETVLTRGRHADDVRADLAEARRVGVRGVPTFAVDGRALGSGPPEVDALLRLLRSRVDAAPA